MRLHRIPMYHNRQILCSTLLAYSVYSTVRRPTRTLRRWPSVAHIAAKHVRRRLIVKTRNVTIRGITACVLLPIAAAANAASWNILADYSTTNNPNGVWSYDRKWTVGGTAADVMTVPWGTSGWYLGNVGNGGPSIQGGGGEWAKNNGNGYPAIRWTAPTNGVFDVDGSFAGIDDRGMDSLVYVVVNGTIDYSDHITAYQQTKSFQLNSIALSAGAPIDFVVVWNGGVYSEYSWTLAAATISAVPEPASALLLSFGVVGLAYSVRRGKAMAA